MIIIVVVKQSKHDLRGTHILSQTHTHARTRTLTQRRGGAESLTKRNKKK